MFRRKRKVEKRSPIPQKVKIYRECGKRELLFYHDNARQRTSQMTAQKLNELGYEASNFLTNRLSILTTSCKRRSSRTKKQLKIPLKKFIGSKIPEFYVAE
ncbi:hypothetical protein CEXT_174731 [Caerostris extrusa]|uniref:Uncharacterized protein n=1 Tax=Caerostris extrusa TaxID=172846 RepID=A0AAV4VDE4_CAEEX|nr:hypothetical protein CEXT_174731 [Caerostris extrusa]